MPLTSPPETLLGNPLARRFPGQRPSLAMRLTVHTALAALLMVAIVSVVLNLALTDSLHHAQDQFLNNKVRVLQKQLTAQPRVMDDLKEEVEEDFAPHQYAQVYARVMDGTNHVLAESPTMGSLLPVGAFPPPVPSTGISLQGMNFRASDGQEFRWLSARTGTSQRDGVIQVALDNTPGEQMLSRYRRQLAAMICTAAIACIVIGFFVSRAALKPLRSISATVARIQPTSLGERLDLHGLPAELYDVGERLNNMLERLEQSFARLSQFSVDLAHELRTPVNNLFGLVETTLDSRRSPEEYREALASALEESVRLRRIIDGLLFIARSDDPRTQIRREEVDLYSELRRLTEMYQVLASDRSVAIELECAPGIEAHLDKTLLQRAVDNLVANAMAHTPAGGTVTIRVTSSPESLRIEVRDTGTGIPSDQLPRVFDRLYRGDPHANPDNRSLGLGLSIVRGIMLLHGGSVDLQSTPGEGTSVCLKFPIHSPAVVAV